MAYHQFTHEDRIRLSVLSLAGHTNADIAHLLGVHRSTVGRELSRNTATSVPGTHVYRPGQAQRQARQRKAAANQLRRKIVPSSALADMIAHRLRRYWSPEQIAGRLKRDRRGQTVVSPETIYQYVYRERPDLRPYLRSQKGKYRRRYGTLLRVARREEAKKKRIEERPTIVERRSRLGDWEGDTVLGQEKTIRILTHTDRRSRFLLATKLETVTADKTFQAILRTFRKLPKRKRQTITYDNGVEFAAHETLERDLRLAVYFARPYHSWERGTNENTNGLLRQFFPKRTPFGTITKQELARVVKLLNTRPRKTLHYQTPLEVFTGCCTST